MLSPLCSAVSSSHCTARFNLTYNDRAPEEPPAFDPVSEGYYVAPPPPPTDSRGRPLFPHCAARAELRAKGKLPGNDVIQRAKARKDGKALRAADGKVLKCPYVVRLKSTPRGEQTVRFAAGM